MNDKSSKNCIFTIHLMQMWWMFAIEKDSIRKRLFVHTFSCIFMHICTLHIQALFICWVVCLFNFIESSAFDWNLQLEYTIFHSVDQTINGHTVFCRKSFFQCVRWNNRSLTVYIGLRAKSEYKPILRFAIVG